MYSRSKALSVETVMVMLVLIIFALVVFALIGAGSSAYNGIVDDKESMQSARVAYSYINMKLKQNDAQGHVEVAGTDFGDTLVIHSPDGGYVTYLFFSEGALYECVAAQGMEPAVAAANRITALEGFEVKQNGKTIDITCVCKNGDSLLTVEGTVGLRS
jgi:hypothetical protein